MTGLKLDEIDRRILRALTRNGRLNNLQLAQEVGLSASPCWQRTRRLEAEGFIRGYTALIDPEKLGLTETVLIEIQLDHHDEASLDRIGAALTAMNEVIEVHLTTGDFDFMVKVAVEGSRGYQELLQRKLLKIPGIRHARSTFVLRSLKQAGVAIPEA